MRQLDRRAGLVAGAAKRNVDRALRRDLQKARCLRAGDGRHILILSQDDGAPELAAQGPIERAVEVRQFKAGQQRQVQAGGRDGKWPAPGGDKPLVPVDTGAYRQIEEAGLDLVCLGFAAFQHGKDRIQSLRRMLSVRLVMAR